MITGLNSKETKKIKIRGNLLKKDTRKEKCKGLEERKEMIK